MTYVFDGSVAPPRPIASVEFVAPYGPLAHVDVVYHRQWLREGHSFGPDLPLRSGVVSSREIPGALLDAGPDSWGRSVLAEALNAQGRGAELVHDGDYLLQAPDVTRQGSLRFSPQAAGGEWVGRFDGRELPGLVDAERLLRAVENYEEREATEGDLQLLLHAASSPGGARPKANICRQGVLSLVKFPSGADRWDVIALEALTLKLAQRCGIRTPEFEYQRLSGGRSILIMRRFDRGAGGLRHGYISAMTLLGRHSIHETDGATYVEQVRRQATFLGDPAAAGRELFRRVVFTVVVNNVDDHLRNYGYLHRNGSWGLSPAFDINPWPLQLGGRPIAGGHRSIEAAIENAEHFSLSKDSAREIVRSIVTSIDMWRELAQRFELLEREVSVMEEALAVQGNEVRRVMASPVLTHKTPPAPPSQEKTWVEGHFRNGTWIEGHWRASRSR